MKDKAYRLKVIRKIVHEQKISSQDELLQLLAKEGFSLTQATLSRDIKQLKIAKMPDYEGGYVYVLPEETNPLEKSARSKTPEAHLAASGFVSIDFSGNFAVVKTKPAYAGGVAAEIDRKSSKCILGTIAGDDTVLVIPREGVERRKLIRVLSEVLPINL